MKLLPRPQCFFLSRAKTVWLSFFVCTECVRTWSLFTGTGMAGRRVCAPFHQWGNRTRCLRSPTPVLSTTSWIDSSPALLDCTAVRWDVKRTTCWIGSIMGWLHAVPTAKKEKTKTICSAIVLPSENEAGGCHCGFICQKMQNRPYNQVNTVTSNDPCAINLGCY